MTQVEWQKVTYSLAFTEEKVCEEYETMQYCTHCDAAKLHSVVLPIRLTSTYKTHT